MSVTNCGVAPRLRSPTRDGTEKEIGGGMNVVCDGSEEEVA
jgi:hypothetical protein